MLTLHIRKQMTLPHIHRPNHRTRQPRLTTYRIHHVNRRDPRFLTHVHV